jgi:hypothetical protein
MMPLVRRVNIFVSNNKNDLKNLLLEVMYRKIYKAEVSLKNCFLPKEQYKNRKQQKYSQAQAM